MDSDHHLPSHTAGTEDGIPRQAGMLPRRKHAAFALRAADWNDSTSACETLLATVITWLEMHRGTIRAARRNIPCGSRDSSTGMWTDGMEHAESTAAAACNAHTASPGGSLPELKLPANGRTAIMPSAVVSPCCWRSVQSSLVPSRAQACDTPRHGGTTSPLSGIGFAVVLLGLCLCSASAAGNPLVRHTVRVSRAAIPTAACTVCARVPPGDWNMDWPFTPCAPDPAIRDCLPGIAPGPGGVLSVFLRRLVPAARCSHRTMINTSLADGSLRSPWEMGTPLPSADTEGTHAAPRESSATPAALCPARCERRTGPLPPVSTAGTPPTSAWIHATTHGLGVGDACE
ncbi:hypothetical protein TcCL_NonESM08458 [Trypanosoma cruzi]|uniref:Uncharacterized protein n=1 Tax=Trypanosoma cruzi (strain CL Brener) TaxID=353153 RepID=Q4DWF6_TRYCC|nr:hypothetical protein Tc00.1047053508365.80 [Trypanosoma cruzi]EAN96851.1 hypothetical protein Tc00.1047053508365.80 [Trypanosoma cruzi]RNC41962.1 hypothetical protein TcCL_NonESM08458 [Trypanosoma cruzi]|eukprot:XP_818702.1 hypothetical protein [Trypanosoma cruzi strain CL Brener]